MINILELIGLEFTGDVYVLGFLTYMAVGAFIIKNSRSATVYYHRQWTRNKPQRISLTSMVGCVILWPLFLFGNRKRF